ncbi:hypothetical protein RM764_40155 [Streptomyces sp. DSM 41699]|uniref:DNA-binding domain-containing protein n=1 Tax=Streptomyces gibsoniae TaxID=3075529 RepID=A0ABU2U7A6_9ACTN|nr:hypothetical protein [Streptomyces sp. DSM 41699]MDT0469115.1 hypothetical protein [Streptomyces sp. DSM 41699]
MTPTQVARRLRVSRKSAYAWYARWRKAAWRRCGPRGRPDGHPG